jgi:hypothetical protein
MTQTPARAEVHILRKGGDRLPLNPKEPLPRTTDRAILGLVRALARQAAREDHERDEKAARRA